MIHKLSWQPGLSLFTTEKIKHFNGVVNLV